MNWLIFGSSNQTVYKPIPVSKRFQYRQPNADRNVKSILRLSDGPRFLHPHAPKSYKNTSSYAVDTSGRKITGQSNGNKTTNVAVLHHFKIKSEEEYVNRRKWGTPLGICNGTYTKFCPNAYETFLNNSKDPLWIGTIFDDSVWQKLIKSFPARYAMFDYIITLY